MAMPVLQNGLTAAQETFAVEVASGKSLSDAYRIAFPQQVATSKVKSIWELASRTYDNVKVLSRVNELRQVAAEHAEMDLTYWLKSLKTNLEHCLQKSPIKDKDGNDLYIYDAAGANKALDLLGKHLGAIKDAGDINLHLPAAPKPQYDYERAYAEAPEDYRKAMDLYAEAKRLMAPYRLEA